jgi:hypothetical protein
MLQNLEHTIRTAHGDSEETYGGDLWVIPMQGVYQGNGAGPLIWALRFLISCEKKDLAPSLIRVYPHRTFASLDMLL